MLKTRIITALTLICALVPALFFASNIVWASIMLVVSVAAIYEWARLIDCSHSISLIYTTLFSALGFLLLVILAQQGLHGLFYQSLLIFLVSLIFWILIAPVLLAKCLIVRNQWLLMMIGFLVVMPLWLAFVFAKGANPWLLLCLLATIWIADTGAYFVGKRFGKHKLAPSISPGKTWEGVFGAMVGVTVFAAILYGSKVMTNLAIFPLLWLVTILGVIGDLFESLIKRQFNKKDSGTLLPGHGGILDRIDGLLPSLPIAMLAIYLFTYFQAIS
jgi:phosphatidate cytidylyltransferase